MPKHLTPGPGAASVEQRQEHMRTLLHRLLEIFGDEVHAGFPACDVFVGCTFFVAEPGAEQGTIIWAAGDQLALPATPPEKEGAGG